MVNLNHIAFNDNFRFKQASEASKTYIKPQKNKNTNSKKYSQLEKQIKLDEPITEFYDDILNKPIEQVI